MKLLTDILTTFTLNHVKLHYEKFVFVLMLINENLSCAGKGIQAYDA